ncbi:MAG: DUF4355 domain-containing protein [Lachnospiraceae bacterium]
MNLEELKKLLESGAITQEAFDKLAAGLKDPEADPKPDPEAEPTPESEPTPDNQDIDKLIQSAVDRVANKLGNQNKLLREELDKVKGELKSEREKSMTEEEKRETAIREREEELERKEREILEKDNRMFAISEIKKAGLDDGGMESMELVDFVMSDSKEDIAKRVTSLQNIIDTRVRKEVENTFKKNGRTPSGGDTGAGNEDNPYSPETFNLTKQMELEKNDPERAKQLKALIR